MMIRIARATGAGLLLLALLAGIPAALWVLGRDALPAHVPSWDQVLSVLANPLTADFLLGLLTIVGAVAWATFFVAVLLEVPGALGRRPARQVRGLGAQRRLAAVLLGAIILTGAAPALASAHVSPATSEAVQVTVQTDRPLMPSTAPQDTSTGQDEYTGQMTTVWETHTVQAGDTLWGIARDRLGDGTRWREVAEANYGLPQPDGHTLTDAHWLQVGWQLRIPGTDHPAPANARTQLTEVTVQPGDTLYDLALEHLGDGSRYPEIFAASRNLAQPGGAHLSDPDIIDAGWHLLIPSATPTNSAPEDNTGRSTDQGSGGGSEPAASTSRHDAPITQPESATGAVAQDSTPEPATDEEAPRTDPDTEAADQEEQVGIPLRTAGGVGALLAAGIVAAIAARRRHTHRTRPPGTRVAMPEPGSPEEAVEHEVRLAANPDGRTAVNLALRDLAARCDQQRIPLPQIRAARLAADASELQLYLESTADLPAPWQASVDRQVWLLTAEDLTTAVSPQSSQAPSPWPALVSVGQDEEDAHVLLDLAHLGHLDVRGRAEEAHAVLAALAVELATSEWADDLQITLVGVLPELVEAIDTSRIRYVPDLASVLDPLETRARHLREHASNVVDAREQWPQEIIITGADVNTQLRARLGELVDLVPHVGIAALTQAAATDGWALDVPPHSDRGRLLPAGLHLRPQRLASAEYAAILNVLAGAERYTAGPSWTQHLSSVSEPALDDLPDPADIEAHPAGQDPAADLDRENPGVGAPMVRVLGDVEIAGIDQSVLAGSPSHLSQAEEMIAYLVLNPGATTEELTRDLWPGREAQASTRQSAVSRARRLLGTNDTGEPYLSLTGTDPLGNSYRVLPQVRSDWDHFTELRGPDPTTTPLPNLRKALSLVRGAPFSRVRQGRGRVRANRYLWADPFAREMSASIIDVACETARRALLEGNPTLAAEAAEVGLRVTQDEERTWRYAIRAHTQLGEHARVAELVANLTTHLTDLDVDPEPETNDLLDELNRLDQHTRRVAG